MGIFLPVALLMDTEARTCKLESLSADLSRNPLGALGPCWALSVRPCRARVVFLLFRKIRDHSRLTLLSTLAMGGNFTEITVSLVL